MQANKTVILAKIEGTYGVDSVPVPGTDALVVEDPAIEPVTKTLERNYALAHYGSRVPVNIGEALKITFSTEVAGSGVVDTPPQTSPLFRAANFTETISAGVSVAYDPNSADIDGESCTIYFYKGGRLHKVLGCRGAAVNLEAKAGEYGKISWEFQGIYAGPVDEAVPSPTLGQPAPPRFVSASFSLDAYAAVIETLSISVANTLARRPDANAATGILAYYISDRQVTAEIDPEAVLIATKDFHGMWAASTTFALAASIGSVAGNRCQISAPAAVFESQSDGDREGLLTMQSTLRLTPSSGNDEVQFLFN